jgi:hypothetical protein
MNRPVKFNLYPSLLDVYQDYLNSEAIYLRYWGNSDKPAVTLEGFEQKQFRGLIDKINRVPMLWQDSEKADRGTAFNEIVDCMILNCKSEKMQIEKVFELIESKSEALRDIGFTELKTMNRVIALKAIYNNRIFQFPIRICREFANYFKGATPQVYCRATLPTQYGDVLLYGYIDELMPTSIHDIKVTGNYEAWKFKDKWQRIVYPYCVNESGGNVTDFEYNILSINENKGETFYETKTEYYNYTEQDKERLTAFVERLIDFLEENRELITDKKIFNL